VHFFPVLTTTPLTSNPVVYGVSIGINALRYPEANLQSIGLIDAE